MTNLIPFDKGFRQQSDAVAVAAKIMIARIRKHIKEDRCNCCKQALLEDNEATGPDKPTAADANDNNNPTGKVRSVINGIYSKHR